MSDLAVSSLRERIHAPLEVLSTVERLRDDLVRETGDRLSAVVLHGSLARDRYRPHRSDVNVVVVLTECW